jgi:hypothetical protein
MTAGQGSPLRNIRGLTNSNDNNPFGRTHPPPTHPALPAPSTHPLTHLLRGIQWYAKGTWNGPSRAHNLLYSPIAIHPSYPYLIHTLIVL